MVSGSVRFLGRLWLMGLVLFWVGWHQAPAFAQEISPELYEQLQYRHIGPKGNRVVAVAGVPGDVNVIYAGAATGGVFKTTDGGIHWSPIFDDQPVLTIGALAVSRSDPNVVWAGTGEAFIRGHISIGHGVYKSTDAGKTWTHMGLDNTGRIPRVVIHPQDPDVVYVAALGHAYGPQPDRGVFRTTDGGTTWEKVLFVDEDTGASDLVMDPNNPRILFAGMWQLIIRSWARESGGPGSGLHMSRDGGDTWTKLSGHGLPEFPWGKVALAVAPSNSDRVYALIEAGLEDGGPGVLWRSDDGGDSWELVSRDHNLNRRPHYYSRMAVLPGDHNEIYFLAGQVSASVDGGATYRVVRELFPDNHDMWIDPLNPDRLIIANDRYVNISTNRGASWLRAGLPVAQMYHVATDDRIPYYVFGNRQDGPAHRGPSNSLTGTQIPEALWTWTGGSESGFTYADPADPNMMWTTGQAGFLQHFDLRTGYARQVNASFERGWPIADLEYRFQWTFPIALSPHDPNRLYVGSQHVHVTEDRGQTWRVISPDLTTNDKSKQQVSGGLTPDNTSIEFYCVLFAIAESPLEEGVVWAGSNDGLVHVTRDGGATWTNVTANLPGLPPWGTVSNIEPSRHAAGTAYLTVDFHQVNNRDPFIYKTTDYGATWTSIGAGIPRSLHSYAHCVREDPVRPGLLYVGTENALYVSFNDGTTWQPLQTNLPHAPVHWLEIQEHFNDLVVATYGRGFWILDDITPLQQLTPEVLRSSAHLFELRPAYRFLTKPVLPFYMGEERDPASTVGHNPPYGASINYYLSREAEADVTLTILDGRGETIRELDGTTEPGINRVWWDLRYEGSDQPRLRTSPVDRPDVGLGLEGWRPLPGAGFGPEGGIRPLVAPGTYTVRLSVENQEFTRPLTVRKDPNSLGSEEGIRAQTEVVLEIRENVSAMADTINQIEWVRKQISDINALLEDDANAEPVVAAGTALDEKLMALEGNFFDLRQTGQGDSGYYPPQLYSKVPGVARAISQSDFGPTASQVEMHESHTEQIAGHLRRLDGLLSEDLAAYNELLEERNLPRVFVGTP